MLSLQGLHWMGLLMKAKKLAARLTREGCHPASFSIGTSEGVTDAYCLVKREGIWTVFYTERGMDHPPIFESKREGDACRFFYDRIKSIVHRHLVGRFRDKDQAEKIRRRLARHGIESRMDRYLHDDDDDPRYAVFVTGTDVFPAREVLGKPLPLTDDDT